MNVRHDPRPSASAPSNEGAPALRIESREQLVFLLMQAAELEHGLMCEYLFAQWTLKQSTDERVTARQLELIEAWREAIGGVVMQEMLHLALATNLLTALGAPPHLDRPNFPILSGWYPPGVQIALVPFGERALRHFIYLERPEGMMLEDAEGFRALDAAEPLTDGRSLMAVQQDFATVGQLYHAIETGFAMLVERDGTAEVFLGSPHTQADAEAFRWPEIISVTDLASVGRAIDAIVEQGEGARGDWREAHFGIFSRVLEELRAARVEDPSFEPAREVVPAYVHQVDDADAPVAMITNDLTARVADLFDAAYEATLMALTRYFVHTDESFEQVRTLARTAKRLMAGVLAPLGIIMTALPIGDDLAGPRAGPAFRMVPHTFYMLPHRDAAWHVLRQRIQRMAERAEELQAEQGSVAAQHSLAPLGGVAEKLRQIHESLVEAAPVSSLGSSGTAPTTDQAR